MLEEINYVVFSNYLAQNYIYLILEYLSLFDGICYRMM